MGLNLTATAGQQDLDTAGREGPFFYYFKLGWTSAASRLALMAGGRIRF